MKTTIIKSVNYVQLEMLQVSIGLVYLIWEIP